MSKYTTEVRYIVESVNGLTESDGFDDIDTLVTNACPYIFNFNFPIFDETYRLTLEKKILMHYYTREISEETVGLWKLRLCNRLREIMPYYNKLYLSELLNFNPLYDVDYTTSGTRTGDEENTNTSVTQNERETAGSGASTSNDSGVTNKDGSRQENDAINLNTDRSYSATTDANSRRQDDGTTNSVGWTLYSDTPQGGIEGIESDTSGSQTVNNLYYLTNATKQTNNTTNHDVSVGHSDDSTSSVESTHQGETREIDTKYNEGITTNNVRNISNNTTEKTQGNETTASTGTVKNLDEYSEHVIGKRGTNTYAKMLTEFRETFLNIDLMIINDLRDLFFGLWA